MNKQPIAWLLAASMSVMQAAPAAAVIANAEQSAETLVSVGNAAGKPGDTVSVSLTLKGNRGLNAMAVWLKYDPNVLEPVNISDKGKFGSDAFDAPKTDTDGQIRLGWTNSKKANANDGIIAVIDFKIKDTAAVGEYAVGISTRDGENFTADFNSNEPFTDVELAVDGGTVTVTDALDKKARASASSAPVISNVYASGFKIKLPSRYEYTCSETELSDFSGVKWNKNQKASGLKPNTEYFVYQRKTGSAEISAPAKIMTSKYDISDVIESVSIGTSGAEGTVLTPVITYRDGFSPEIAGELTYCWSAKDWAEPSVSMNESYTVTAEDAALGREMQVTVAALNCKGLAKSNAVTAGRADYSGSVKSPVIKEIIADGFVISAEAGYEYLVSEDGTIPENAAWASLDSDVSVTGKSAGKTYYVFARTAETEASNASEPSSPVSVKILSGNASLTSLTVSSGRLTPKFSPDVTDYTVYVPYGRSLPRIKAAVGTSNSTVDFEQAKGFAEGKNTAVITVTAENKTDIKQYTITFVRQEELSETPYIPSNGTVEPCVAGAPEKSGWNAICSEIAASGEGKTVTVEMNDATELPKEVLEFIRNKDVNLVLKTNNGLIWTINGNDVTDPQTLNLEASISVDSETDDAEYADTEETAASELPPIASNGTVEPCVAGDPEKSGWNAVCDEIAAAADGKTVTVKMNDTTELPKEVLEFIQNRDVSIALKMKNGAVWTVNGMNVYEPKTVNMEVSTASRKSITDMAEGLGSEKKAVPVKLYRSGTFGFDASLTISLNDRYNGYYASLYGMDRKTGDAEYRSSSQTENGKFSVSFSGTDTSAEYAVVFTREPLVEDISASAGVTDVSAPFDAGTPDANIPGLPQLYPPAKLRRSGKKRRYRIVRRRRLDDMVFVF